MDHLIAAAFAGLVAGIAVAMPLGAIGVLLVQEGMSAGWRPAAAGATGVAVIDLCYAGAAVAIGASLSRALDGWERTVHIAGAVLLGLIAVRGLTGTRPVRAVPQPNARHGRAQLLAPAADPKGVPPWKVAARFALLTAVNPLTAVYFVALAAGLGQALNGPGRAGAFVIAVFAASWAWQLLLVSFGALAGARLPAGASRVTGGIGYLVVLAYAARLALT